MHPLTQREIEIEKLREQDNLTFKEIGLHFHINASRASFLYRQIRRKRNEQRRQEICQEQNARSVSIKLTLGEIVQLRRILSDYCCLRRLRVRATTAEYEYLDVDVDYINAEKLQDVLFGIEKAERDKA